MTITLADTFATDLADTCYDTDEGAGAYSFTPAGGAATSITANFGYDIDDGPEGADALGVTGEMKFRTSEVADDPTGGTVVIGSDTWEVVFAQLSPDGHEWLADLQKQ